MKRVGHKGADLIVPGNTRESFDAALATGVDMIEFDVLPDRGSGRLVLAHDFEDARSRVPLGLGALAYARAVLPGRAAAAIRSGFCNALMAHWRLVDSRLVRAVSEAGGELYVWTVDELPRIKSLERLGVTGVITNDPRLFAALA